MGYVMMIVRGFVGIMVGAALLVGCGGSGESTEGGSELSGTIRIDGSSTVYPITEAVAEEFGKTQPRIRVTVARSGTGGGFKKFDTGETDMNNASRPITPAEAATARSNGIDFIELPIAYDGLSILVNPKNDFVAHMTVEELRKTWEPNSTVKKWSDIRAGWPDREVKLYGPGPDSGTFDYFTEAIVGKARSCRADYTASEDDNTLVMGIAGDINALGFFGFAYYEANIDKLKLVPVDGGKGPVLPSPATIMDGTYSPLSRPVFIYLTRASADRPEVRAFVEFYMNNAGELSREVGYIALPEKGYELAKARFAANRTGSVFEGKEHTVGITIEELLAAEN